MGIPSDALRNRCDLGDSAAGQACLPQEMMLLPCAKSQETFGPEELPYRMLERLGKGATATVYRCQRDSEDYAPRFRDRTDL